VGGVKFPLALAELGLIDEYELVVHPRIVGHGANARGPLNSDAGDSRGGARLRDVLGGERE